MHGAVAIEQEGLIFPGSEACHTAQVAQFRAAHRPELTGRTDPTGSGGAGADAGARATIEVGLPGRGISPGPDAPVFIEGQRVQVSSGDGHGIGEAGRNDSLSPGVVAPAEDLALSGQGYRVRGAGGDGYSGGQVGGNLSLSLGVEAPSDDRAVGLKR